MVIVDVPVDTSQEAVRWSLEVIPLPSASRQTVFILYKGRKAFKLIYLWATVSSSIRNSSIASQSCWARSYVVFYLAINIEEKLILQYRTSDRKSVSVSVSIVDWKRSSAHTRPLERCTCKISIGRALEIVGSALGYSINATTSKSALSHIVRRNRNSHLLQSIERDWHSATRQRTWLHTKRVVERSTIDGNTRLTIVTSTNGHSAGRTRLRSHLHNVEHCASDSRHSSHLCVIKISHGTRAIATHGVVGLSRYHNLLNHLRALTQRGVNYRILSQSQLHIRELSRLETYIRYLNLVRTTSLHTHDAIMSIDIRNSTIYCT